MKEILLKMALYHQWSGNRILEKLATVPSEILGKELESSFRSINKTLFHILKAEIIWWQRVQLTDHPEIPGATLENDLRKMTTEMEKNYRHWVEFIEHSDEAKLQGKLDYKNSKGIFFSQPLNEVLLHLFNHQTYHIGQIITLLRQCRIDQLPATDFIEFARR